ncbi:MULTISPECIES: hypothetical protein [Cupriavidus]|uniref:hypothetical protein n=1 Tax=Cupriavidus TaxID=106589 RepID=UPI0009BFCFBE|nr:MULTISPECIES: hypothetical protein [Cupriavidus]
MNRKLVMTLLVVASAASVSVYAQKTPDPYTDGAKSGTFDPYTDGAKKLSSRSKGSQPAARARQSTPDPYTEGANQGKRDTFTDGARTRTRDPYTDGARSN